MNPAYLETGGLIVPPRPRASLNPVWGLADDHAYWGVVYDLYDEDKLEAAREVLNKLGEGMSGGNYIGLVRLIESELHARKDGIQKTLADWINLEYLPHEQEGNIGAISHAIVTVLEAERKRFNWRETDKVLVTLLSTDNDAPWATARFGYCTQKADYYKICIPFHATVDPHRFVNVLSHEFGHVISLSTSKGRISTWLGEGFSVFASNDLQDGSRRHFMASPKAWLAPGPLENQFRATLDLGTQEKWLAYQQAGWLIRFLVSLKGEAELMHLFAEYADEGILRNLKLLALGESKTRDAIHHVYGLGLEDFFAKAKNSLSAL